MADRTSTAALETVAVDLRAAASTLISEISKARALVVTFRLAANADESRGQPAIYWPDMMEFMEAALPSEDKLDRALSAIAQRIEEALIATGQADSTTPAPATSRRRMLADPAMQ